MKDYIEERAVEIAYYIIEQRLLKINPALAGEARKVLNVNKQERHIRGGFATREKYLHQHG